MAYSENANSVHSLQIALSRAEDLIERIKLIPATIKGHISFATSLGLEDQAILNAVAASGAALDIFTLDTGRLFAETIETIAESERRYGIKIRVLAPEASQVEMLIERDGVLGFRNSIEARKTCCHVRKVQPLQRALHGAAGWVTGLRRGQSGERAHLPFAAWDDAFKLVKVNPIADWPFEKLEAYVRENAIPVNPLHAKGFPSIGCAPCTRAVEPGEDLRAGRWWWERDWGKECGLHNRPR
jgi:phosphoadenosine phosphosulfate reductase